MTARSQWHGIPQHMRTPTLDVCSREQSDAYCEAYPRATRVELGGGHFAKDRVVDISLDMTVATRTVIDVDGQDGMEIIEYRTMREAA